MPPSSQQCGALNWAFLDNAGQLQQKENCLRHILANSRRMDW
jgi:hypothetical protein